MVANANLNNQTFNVYSEQKRNMGSYTKLKAV